MTKKLVIYSLISIMLFSCKNYNDDFLKFPTIVEVIDEFFDNYEFDKIENGLTLQHQFQKKPDGWHVVTQKYDYNKKRYIIEKDELFWSLKKERFNRIDYRRSGPDAPKEKNKKEYIHGFNNNKHGINKAFPKWNSYYNIFPYYGYYMEGEDVIDLLKDAKNLPDSTLYALARSYSGMKEALLRPSLSGLGHETSFDITSGQNSLNKNQLKKYRFYAHTANEKFNQVHDINPRFKTILGEIHTKLSNEYVTSYIDLLQYQNEKEARKELKKGLYDPFIINMAKNYLNSCDKNAILFTNGDNHTHPLLYVQEIYGFRKDVRVINLTYLNTEKYIDLMKRPYLTSMPIPSSLEHNDYKTGTRDYTPIQEYNKKYVKLQYAMGFITSNKPIHKLNTTSGKINYCPTKKLKLTVNKQAAKQFVSKEYHDKIENEIKFNIKGNGLFKNKLMVFDILANFNWERPIYFAITCGQDNFMGLEKYFQLEGFAYRLVPYSVSSTDGQTGIVHTNKMYQKLMHEFEWGDINTTDLYFDKVFAEEMAKNIKNVYARLAESLYQKGENKKATQVLDKCMREFPSHSFELSHFSIPIIDLYYKLDQKRKGDRLLATMMDDQLNKYNELNKLKKTDNIISEIDFHKLIINTLVRLTTIHKLTDTSYNYVTKNGKYYKEKYGYKKKIDSNTYRINTFMDDYSSINY